MMSASPCSRSASGRAAGDRQRVRRAGAGDTCTAEAHHRWSMVGPDGLVYPSWHPPTDPQRGCTFGHEHGRDPCGPNLYGDVGDIPFGYANQMQDIAEPHRMRHEDHVGHKVEWEDDMQMHFADGAGPVLDVRCDVLVKLHQGTHSRDAFTNNVHELVYHLKCTDRTELRVTVLAAIGTAGEMVASCDGDRHIQAGVPTPPNSPNGGGKRRIPDRACVEQFMRVPPGERFDYRRVAAYGSCLQVGVPVGFAAGRALDSGSLWFNPYVSTRAVFEGYVGEEKPADDFRLGMAIDIGADVSFDRGRDFVLRLGASLGDRHGVIAGLHARL